MKVFNFLVRRFGRYPLLSLIFVIVIAAVSVLLLFVAPELYNPVVQLLFDFFLFLAALWFGVSISNEEARKSATETWLFAAETACKELLVMGETARRMRWGQGEVCQAIEKIVPDIPPKELEAVGYLVGINCTNCSAGMANLQNHIDNIFQHWSVFIDKNCDETECEGFHNRLDQRRHQIRVTFEDGPQREVGQYP